MPATAAPRAFSLIRAFSLWSIGAIVVLAACAAFAMSRFISDRMLMRDAQLTAEFVSSVIVTPEVVATLSGRGADVPRNLFVQHIRDLSSMPDVLRANVYASDRRVAWSSDPRLVGQAPGDNDELEEAMAGKLVMHRGRTDGSDIEKPEHKFLARSTGQFVETYVPVRNAEGQVIGAVELYRIPRALFDTLRRGTQLIWGTAALGAALLFAALFWVVRRGDRTLRWQHDRLIESERLAAVGEMAASVAHGIRNPLASIRSSAELALDADPRDLSRSAHDIIASVDRAERWVADLLRCAVPPAQAAAGSSADVSLAATTAFDQYREEFRQRHLDARLEIEPGLPHVRGATDALTQVIASLLANACEASANGAQIRLAVRRQAGGVRIAIEDQGSGIAEADLSRVFEPYFTSKARGLGLGLPLARAAVERSGGSLSIASAAGRGTVVRIELPGAAAGGSPA